MTRLFKALCASVIALATLSASASAATLQEIKARGYIQVGTSGQGAPYTYVNENNELVGYDIDWAKVVSKALGVEIRWSKMPWPGLLPALQAGQVDMLMSAVKITDERKKAFDFSIPYGAETAVAIVPSTNTEAHSFDAIKGHVVAAVTASFQGDAAVRVGGYKQHPVFPERSGTISGLEDRPGGRGRDRYQFDRSLPVARQQGHTCGRRRYRHGPPRHRLPERL